MRFGFFLLARCMYYSVYVASGC